MRGNRLPEARLAEGPKCGRCGQALTPAEPIALDGETFEKYIQGTQLPIVADFWADWCGPCKMMAPAFSSAAQQRPLIRFVKVDTDRAPEISSRYGIRGIPTLIAFRDGAEIARVSGAMSASQLLGWIDQNLR